MEIKLKVPKDSYIESMHEGNSHTQYTWKDQGIEVRDAYLRRPDEGEPRSIGKVVLVPFGNIVYIVMDS